MKIILKRRAAASAGSLVVLVKLTKLAMLLFTQIEPVMGIALCSAGAILHDRGGDVWEMANEDFI
jgi:hypothetical protein